MLSCLVFKIILVLVLRGYLIELNTKTQYTQLNSIFWCFLLIWCKNIKIFVFCARIKLKGVDTIRTYVKLTLYQQENTCYSYWCKVSDRCSPTPLLTVSHHLTLYCSLVELEDLEISCLTDAELVISLWTSLKHCVISFALFDAR